MPNTGWVDPVTGERLPIGVSGGVVAPLSRDGQRANRNWRSNLSQSRRTPDQIEAQRLRNQMATERLQQIPLQNAAREAQLLRAQANEEREINKYNDEIAAQRERLIFFRAWPRLKDDLEKAGFGIGTPQHAEAVLSFRERFPRAAAIKDVYEELNKHSVIHDKEAEFRAKMEKVRDAAALKQLEKSLLPPPTPKPTATPLGARGQIQKGYAISPEQFSNLSNAQRVNAEGKGDPSGSLVKFIAGESTKGEPQTHTMTVPEFNRFKSAFGMQPLQEPAASATPSAAPSPTAEPIVTPSPSPEATATPATTSTTLRYNPETGEYE